MASLRAALAAFTAAALLVSGCGSDSGSGPGDTAPKGGGPVSLLVFGAPEELAVLHLERDIGDDRGAADVKPELPGREEWGRAHSRPTSAT